MVKILLESYPDTLRARQITISATESTAPARAHHIHRWRDGAAGWSSNSVTGPSPKTTAEKHTRTRAVPSQPSESIFQRPLARQPQPHSSLDHSPPRITPAAAAAPPPLFLLPQFLRETRRHTEHKPSPARLHPTKTLLLLPWPRRRLRPLPPPRQDPRHPRKW